MGEAIGSKLDVEAAQAELYEYFDKLYDRTSSPLNLLDEQRIHKIVTNIVNAAIDATVEYIEEHGELISLRRDTPEAKSQAFKAAVVEAEQQELMKEIVEERAKDDSSN